VQVSQPILVVRYRKSLPEAKTQFRKRFQGKVHLFWKVEDDLTQEAKRPVALIKGGMLELLKANLQGQLAEDCLALWTSSASSLDVLREMRRTALPEKLL
jgi:hypothetical protein